MQTPDRRLIPVLCMGPNHPPPKSILTLRGYIAVPTENMAILYIFSHKIMVISWNQPDYRLSCTEGLLLVYTCSFPPPFLHSGHVYGANIDALSTKAEEATSRGDQGTFYHISKAHIKGSEWQEPVKDKKGNLLSSEQEMEERQTKHFKEKLIEQATSNS